MYSLCGARNLLVKCFVVMVLGLAVTVQASTLAYWRFEDSLASDGSLTLTPVSGTPETMTYSTDTVGDLGSTAPYTANAKSFEVVAGDPEGLQIQYNSNLAAALATGSFTVEAFVKIDEGGSYDYDRIFIGDNFYFGLDGGAGTTKLWLYARNGSGSFVANVYSADEVPVGEWVHVAVVGTYVDTGADSVKVQFYINYRANGPTFLIQGVDGHALSEVTGDFTIGDPNPFDGKIDELRISDAVLAPSEFLTHRTDLAYWRFEDSTASDGSLTLTPVSGTPETMTYSTDTVGTVRTSGSDLANAKSFEVVAGDPEGLQIQYNSNLAAALATGSFTVEAFVKIDEGGSYDYDRIFIGDNFYFGLDNDAGTTKLWLYAKKGSSGFGSVFSTDEVPVGEWVHVAVVGTYSYNDTSADSVSIQLYINYKANGSPLVIEGVDGHALSEVTGDFTIGDPNPFDGKIDELRITSRALTPAEFMIPRTTLAYWRFENSKDSEGLLNLAAFAAYPGGGMTYAEDTIGDLRSGGGIVTNTYSFDVGTTNPEGMRIGYNAALAGALASCDFTIESFIKIDAGGGDKFDAIFNTFVDGSRGVILRLNDATNLWFYARRGDDLGNADVSSPETLPVGEWVHVAAVGTYSDNGAAADTVSVQLYVDYQPSGSPVEIPGVNGRTMFFDTGSFYIGDTTAFDGQIDELRISNSALTPSEFLAKNPTGTLILLK